MQAPNDIPVPPRCLRYTDYSVGWICALPKEQAAAQAMLDARHAALRPLDRDQNNYTLGSIGNHNVVIACLPSGEIGTNSAANLLTQMINTFPSIRFGLMVGIGGGVPPQVRLGDIVVSKPSGTFPGVVQWDLGKSEETGFRRTGALDRPPKVLLTALASLETSHELRGTQIPAYVKEMAAKYPKMEGKYTWSSRLKDPMLQPCEIRRDPGLWASIALVVYELLVGLFRLLSGRYEPTGKDMPPMPRSDDDDGQPRAMEIHYGLIASGNRVVKDSAVRDQINRNLGGEVLCLEMEAAGLMNNFPCIVVRGICDYADAQKNKDWQEYAAALAAAFTKELLQHVHSADVANERPIKDILLEQVHDAVKDTQTKINRLESHMHDAEVSKVLDWLTTANHGQQQTLHLGAHKEGTCQWIFETRELQSWLDGSKRTLLCQGMPGSGKTIITSVVINHLTTRFRDDSSIGIAYLFCTFRHQKTQTTEKLLASVLRQLASDRVPFPTSTKELYDRHRAKQTHPSQDQLMTDIETVAKLYSKVYVVVDALDECDLAPIRQFPDALFKLQRQCNINIFATSRFIPDITQSFAEAKSSFLEISARPSDIVTYLEAEMPQSSPNVIRGSPTLQDEIKREISEAANGMFLLAHIYLNLLQDKMTAKEVRQELQTFRINAGVPKDKALNKAYRQVIGRINQQESGSKNLAMEVLLWLTFAKRDLTTSELRHGVATQKGMTTIGSDDLPDLGDIGRVCVGLVTVDEKSGIIQLVHYTTQEYFAKVQTGWFPKGELALFGACITYLSFTDFESGFCETDDELEQRRKSFPLCNYAASHWGDHVSKDAKPSKELLRFLDSTEKVEASIQAQHAVKHYSSHTHYSQEMPRGVTGLHLAAYFGLTGLARALLEDGERCSHDSPDSDNQTPLLWAARNDHEAVVDLLIDANAALEARDKDQGATPLIWAARKGHEKVVRLLLERGSELNARDYLERTPLSLAAFYKHEPIIRLLLKRGGVIHPNDEAGKVKLLATGLEHHTVIEMLFGHEYRLALGGNGKDETIPYTAETRSETTLQSLLNGDDDVDEVDQQGRTPLSRAAERGDEQIVEMLIKSGKANINARDQGHGETPLIRAAKEGHDAIVRMLLDAGADVNVQEQREGETALTMSIESRNEATIQALLDRGADVNSRDHTNHTPLHAASWQGSGPAMKMLLDRHVDVNARNDDGQTPIFSACAYGYIELVRMLLDAGADIEAKDEEDRTPLFWAVALAQHDMVELLLEKGVNINARNKGGRTAMFTAIGSGEMKVVNLLLDASHIDDVHRADEEGIRPIDWAKEGGNKDIIRLLHHRSQTI
ncbi:ankyrin repeat-containing domain protein [Trichoderma novae-zelandiae]